MTPDTPTDDQLEAAVRRELDDRDNVTGFEIVESESGHLRVEITEETEGDDQRVLYEVRRQQELDGSDDLDWEYLGDVFDD